MDDPITDILPECRKRTSERGALVRCIGELRSVAAGARCSRPDGPGGKSAGDLRVCWVVLGNTKG